MKMVVIGHVLLKIKTNIYYYDSFGVVMPQNQYDIFRNESENIYYNTSDDLCNIII